VTNTIACDITDIHKASLTTAQHIINNHRRIRKQVWHITDTAWRQKADIKTVVN